MCRLIETIRLQDGDFNNIAGHEQRLITSFQSMYGKDCPIDLEALLKSSEYPRQGLYKCRFTYDDAFHKIEFEPYVIKPVTSLKVVHHASIDYRFKFSDRSALSELYAQRGGCDDVLIIKNGYVTDTSYANIVFKQKDKWITPATYLLQGTMRQFLIERNKIEVMPVQWNDIYSFEKFKLINSMLGWDGPEVDVSNIV